MLAPPPRIWPEPPPAHVNGTSAATRYGYSSLAQILPSPQDKEDQTPQTLQQPSHPTPPVYSEEPVKLRKETKHLCTADWRRKDRGRVKIEPGITPCQVPEVTTSSKHEQNGSIPVGIAVARQRVQQQSTPPPLTVLTCEERSTNHVTGWTGPPPHWHYPAGLEQNLPLAVPPLQLGRDPLSGQLLILPSGSIGESVQRTVLWPSSSTANSSAPPPLVMPSPQPVLLDRFVALAPQGGSPSHHHSQSEKRRNHDHSSSAIHGGGGGGLTVGLFPPQPPPQAPFLMMPFSHQNNSLLLSTQLTEHNLNTMVVTNHQLSESAVLNPMEVITSPVDGFGGGRMIQQIPPSVVISHTETNSFVRSDINAVYPSQHIQPQPVPPVQPEEVVVKEEAEIVEESPEEEMVEEETKAEVMDASNQTESPVEESEGEEDVAVKEEVKEQSPAEESQTAQELPPSSPEPTPLSELDMSGLDLLCCVASADKETSTPVNSDLLIPQDKEEKNSWNSSPENISSGLGLLCTAVERIFEQEEVKKKRVENTMQVKEESLVVKTNDNFEDNLSDVEQGPFEDIVSSPKRKAASPEKEGEWYTSSDKESNKESLKLMIKRRPGRPKKKSKVMRKSPSPSRHEPPVLQPWSATLDDEKSPLGSPPTLTPHKRKLSNDVSQESDEGSTSSTGHPPPLSPAACSTPSLKKRKVGRPKKCVDPSPEKTNHKPSTPPKPIVDYLPNSKHHDLMLSTGSQNKIKPKLKAEAKVKDWCDDEELDLSPGKENSLDDDLLPRAPVWPSPIKSKPIKKERIGATLGHLVGNLMHGKHPRSLQESACRFDKKRLMMEPSPPRKPKVKIEESIKTKVSPEVNAPLRMIIKPKSPSASTKSNSTASVKLPQNATSPKSSQNTVLAKSLQNSASMKSPQTTASTKSPQTSVSTKSPQTSVSTKPPQPTVSSKSPETTVSTKLPQPTVSSKSPETTVSTKSHQTTASTKSPQHTPTPPVVNRTPPSKVITPHRTPVPRSSSTPNQPLKIEPVTPKKESVKSSIPDCKITEEHLRSLPCRILTISDGQFYPGEVTKVILPGIYEVHIYKERCRKPQILCQEEVFTTAVPEVHCTEDMFIPAGTRVCAYWSQQYSCFYPGRVVSDSAAGQVPIDFDDGDNGTIERTSVRFLPQDYPIVEQPPNPLIGKRKRYNSTTSSEGHKNNNDITESDMYTSTDTDCRVKQEEKEQEKQPEIKTATKSASEGSRSSSNGNMSDSYESSCSDDQTPSEVIRSVVEGFFRSEQEEKERQKNGEKIHKHRKHHKHRDGCKSHKCKHSKHHRSHKHKHSRDDPDHYKKLSGEKERSTSREVKEKNKRELKEDEEDLSTNDSSAAKSKSKVSAQKPEKQEKELWSWVGEGVKRGRALGPRGKGLKMFYKTIQRGNEIINTGDCAVFVSTGRPDRPFIGQIESFWQCHMKKNMFVKIAWFYHPEETIGCPDKLPCPGGVFKSSHVDSNDVQTISHRCEVLSLPEFQKKANTSPHFLDTVYEKNDTYFLAGFYDPSNITLTLEPEVSAVLEAENKKDTA